MTSNLTIGGHTSNYIPGGSNIRIDTRPTIPLVDFFFGSDTPFGELSVKFWGMTQVVEFFNSLTITDQDGGYHLQTLDPRQRVEVIGRNGQIWITVFLVHNEITDRNPPILTGHSFVLSEPQRQQIVAAVRAVRDEALDKAWNAANTKAVTEQE